MSDLLAHQTNGLLAHLSLDTVQLLNSIISNIIKNPDDKKFRKIKVTNPKFAERVGKYPDAMLFLSMSGFNKLDDMLSYDNEDLKNLKITATVLSDKINGSMNIFNAEWFARKYNSTWDMTMDEHNPYDGLREYWRKCFADRTSKDSIFHVMWRYSSDEEALFQHQLNRDKHGEAFLKEVPHVPAMIEVPNVPANLRSLPNVYVYRGPSVQIRQILERALNTERSMTTLDQVVVLFCKGRFIHKLFISIVNPRNNGRDPLMVAEDAAKEILK